MATDNLEGSVDEVFKALSNPERRKLLDSLIADSPPDAAAGVDIEGAVDTAMYHRHLPKLANYRLITWNREAGRVTKGPNFEVAAEILSTLKTESDVLALEEASV